MTCRNRGMTIGLCRALIGCWSLQAQSSHKKSLPLPYLSAQWLQLWDSGGRPTALIPYSMPVRDLIWRGPVGDRSTDIRLRLHYTGQDRSVHDSAWHWRLDSSAVAPQSLVASGYLLLAATTLPKEWALSATDDASRAVIPLPLPHDTSAGAASFELSDLVVGDSVDGAAWHNGQEIIFVSGATNHDRARPLELYYQLRSGVPRTHVSTTVSVSAVIKRGESVAFRLVTADHLNAGLTTVSRTINLARKNPGRYTFRIVVRDPDGTPRTRQQVMNLR
jgi:hypothetical protein